jgi:hypothetical protein
VATHKVVNYKDVLDQTNKPGQVGPGQPVVVKDIRAVKGVSGS